MQPWQPNQPTQQGQQQQATPSAPPQTPNQQQPYPQLQPVQFGPPQPQPPAQSVPGQPYPPQASPAQPQYQGQPYRPQAAPQGYAPREQARVPSVPAPHPQSATRAYLPIFVFLAYTAFLMTGFGWGQHLGKGIGDLQPLPIYLFFGLLLLTLQEVIASYRSHTRFAYVFVTSAFAILFAAEAYFHPFAKGNFTLTAYTYIIINVLLVVVYLWDVLSRRMEHSGGLRGSLASYSTFAADFAGLAILFFVAAILLDFLGPRSILRFFGFPTGTPYLIVDLNAMLGLHLKAPINTLEGLNYVAGLVALAVTLLLLVVVGVLLPTMQDGGGQRMGFNATLRAVWAAASNQLGPSLSLVLGPFVWLIPAFSSAALAQMITDYLNRSAASKGTILDLFNPFSLTSRDSYGQGLETLALLAFTLAMVVLAVAVVEHNHAVLRHALRIISGAARAVLVIWVFFIYSLAVINAIAILIGLTTERPFQVGAPGLISLIVAILYFWRESLRRAPAPANTTAVSKR